MLITTGTVTNGVIQIEGNDLPEGTTVTLILTRVTKLLNSTPNKKLTYCRPSPKPREAS